MKIIHLFVFLIIGQAMLVAQPLEGRFEGALVRDGSVQLVNFNLYQDRDVQKGTYEIPEAGLFEVPLERIETINDTLHIHFYYGNFFCFSNESGNQITGISERWDPKLRLHVKKTSPIVKPYRTEQIRFANDEVELSGMIFHPTQETSKKKYVVLVHGSGAQDRYSPYYISLAHRLATHGYGVLLYDKRGTGGSFGNFEEATMVDLANDANAALRFLRNNLNTTTHKIGFLGTSQGGWIVPLAANQAEQCDFVILNVGPAVSVFQQDVDRVAYSMKSDGWPNAVIDSAVGYTRKYFQHALEGSSKSWQDLSKFADRIHNKSWASYLNFATHKDDFDWWRKNDFDPRQALESLSCRALCIFGELDPLVPPAENTTLMRSYLTTAGIEFQLEVIPGVIHDMKTFQGLNGDHWDWPNVYWNWRKEPDGFMATILQFLEED